MKEILVVAYYFPPLNGAPAWRPFSWARFFKESNIKPTILTRHWNGNETTWEEHVADIDKKETFEQNESYDVYHLPSQKTTAYKFFHQLNISLLKKIYFTALYFCGIFNTEVNAYITFRKKLKSLLESGRFDTVIITGPPPNIYRLINVTKKFPAVKTILDFRDLNSNSVLTKSDTLSLKDKLFNFLFNTHGKRWMNKADLITTVTPSFQEYLQKQTSTKVEVVFNGYDNDFFDEIKKEVPEKFTVSLVGAIYPLQNYQLILRGLHNFLAANKANDVQVNCIGILMHDEVASDFRKELNDSRVYLSARVTKTEAVKYVKNAHCLLFTAWDDRPGMIPAKFYDYLASGTFIINCPGDDGFIDHIIKESHAGITINSDKEFTEVIQKMYDEWKDNRFSSRIIREDLVARFSRKNQAGIMAGFIRELHRN